MMGWHDAPRRLLCLSVWQMRPRYSVKQLVDYFALTPLQYRQVRNELAIEKIVRQRSIDGRSQFQRFSPPSTTLNVPPVKYD